jgi:tetratricopeptide (TPR) repeat protein
MMRRSNNLLLSFALCLTALAPAHAAEPPPGSSSSPESDKADALFRDGNVLYKQQKFAEAKALYESAYRLKASHDIAANLAYAEMRLGDNRSAAEHLSVAVRLWPPTGKEDKRKYAVERLQTAKAEVFALTVGVGVNRAEVFVDGKSVGISPLPGEIFLVPGSHMLVAKLGGYQDATLSVEATKGGARTVALDLLATAPVPALTASTLASSPPVPTGSAKGSDPPVVRSGPNTAVLATGGTAAGAALIAGVVFTVLSNGKANDAETLAETLRKSGAPRPCQLNATDCTTINSKRLAQNTLADAAMGGFITAGVLALGTVGYGLFAPRSKAPEEHKRAGVRVVPLLTSQQGGVLVVGAW